MFTDEDITLGLGDFVSNEITDELLLLCIGSYIRVGYSGIVQYAVSIYNSLSMLIT